MRYECPLCPERFKTIGDKKRHLQDVHPRPKKES